MTVPPGTRHVHVVTVSDRCARGEAVDRSGPLAASLLTDAGFQVTTSLVPDGAASVTAALAAALADGARAVVTTGGTGVTPRDQTPEGTRPLLVAELPGIAEELRRRGAASVPTAVLSRGLAGIAALPPASSPDREPGVSSGPGESGESSGSGGTSAAGSPVSASEPDQAGAPDHPGARRAVVVNLPGSTGAVRDGVGLLAPLLAHLVDQLDGGDHA